MLTEVRDIITDTYSEVRAMRADQRAWHTEAENQKVLSWLSPLEFSGRQEAILANNQPETLRWLWKNDRIQSWERGDSPRLWCRGKSTLSLPIAS